jgi:hypothetical protein
MACLLALGVLVAADMSAASPMTGGWLEAWQKASTPTEKECLQSGIVSLFFFFFLTLLHTPLNC